ncbi:membrane protein [cyanobiont of Ornithocercus magnificus]|nr:membrane protein [cyanobiont of Ornithocercus magnificus]
MPVTLAVPLTITTLDLLLLLLFLLIIVFSLCLVSWWAYHNFWLSERYHYENLAKVIDPLPPGGEGHVRWHNQSWVAASIDLEQPLLVGELVVIVGRDGKRLQVLPLLPKFKRQQVLVKE